eukprot:94180_1
MATVFNLSVFLTLYNVVTLSAAELVKFGFSTYSGTFAKQDNVPVIVTLWFGGKIYEANLEPIDTGTCNAETKMMLESNTYDSLKIEDMKIETDSVWYGVDTIMVGGAEIDIPCLSNDSEDCISASTGGIYKQMIYFDTSKPDEFITQAQWSNAMNIYPHQEIQTCDPSNAPSKHPTRYPTSNPTAAPTLIPTFNPTLSPTLIPTVGPTQSFTLIPTPSPTLIPSESTTSPSLATIAVSIRSTVLSSTQISLSASTPIISNVYKDRQSGSVTNMMWPYGVIFIGIALIAACCGALLLLYCCRYRRSKRRKREVQKEEHGQGSAGSNDWIQLWLEEAVGLPQYVDSFVKNGYSNVESVGNITDKEQLVEMGIDKKGHRMLLMCEIDKLRTNKQGMPDVVIPVRVVEQPKANEELLQGNTKKRSSEMILLQSLAVAGSSGEVIVEEGNSNDEMGEDDPDEIVMNDLCIDGEENVTNDGMRNDEFIVEDDDPCTFQTVY